MKTLTLSESAVALLRFRVKGWAIEFRESDLPAFQELVDAGILEPNGRDLGLPNKAGVSETSFLLRLKIISSVAASIRLTGANSRKQPGN